MSQPVAPAPRLPSFLALFGVFHLGNSAVVAGIIGYLALDWAPGADAGDGASAVRGALIAYASGATVIDLAATLLLGLWAYRPFARLRRALAAGVPSAQLDPVDVRSALLLPRRALWTAALLWGAGVALLPLYVERGAAAAALDPFVVDMTIAGACLTVSASVVSYYVMYATVALRVAPALLAHGTIDHLPPFRPYRMYAHLWLAVLVLGVTSPVAVLVLSRHTDSPWAGWYIVGFFLVVGLFQVTVLTGIIAGSLGRLEGRMIDVREGRLHARAEVRALDTFGIVMSHFNRMVEGLVQRDLLREAFGRYVTKQIADEILAGRVALGGELRTATVLFSDIRGFTTMSEGMAPTEVVAFLNRYLDEMVDCVFQHGGILDKFIGDAVMAVFGVPVSQGTPQDDATAAVRCAIEMNERLARMNAARVQGGEPPIAIGVGLHTGELVAGNIGSPKRMEYTVIGDTVNVSSRIEGLTKTVGQSVLMSAATAALVGDRFALLQVGEAPLRGRAQPVALYTLAPITAAAA